jgi:hypothetical protein
VLQKERIVSLAHAIERTNLVKFPVDTPDIKGEYDILVNELTKKYKPEMLIKSDGCYSV